MIWAIMKKLKKLLNEFMENEEKRWPDKLTRISNIDNSWEPTFELENWYYFNQWYIISKQFWFIKRLVDNDKIDLTKLEDNSDWYWIELWDDCYEVLALLSIQDEPIEFLVSILK